MEQVDPYLLIIQASVIIILSFFFGEVSKRTNVPSVLMLIVLGIIIKIGLDAIGYGNLNFFPILEILGIIGLIMIVLEAALELKLERDKFLAIGKALTVALLGLIASTWVAAIILEYFIDGMSTQSAWLYATPLSILSSAIIIPSVTGLKGHKKEFHIYESTFSDILGIMLFYFLTSQLPITPAAGETLDVVEHTGTGGLAYLGNVLITIVVSLFASYAIVLVFQNIKSHVKLFLLIAVLLLLYAIGKKLHLSSLIIVLIFGLLIANMRLFFQGPLRKWLNYKKALHIYEGLHVVTIETAFVVRTFFFVIFGVTISLASLLSVDVAIVSLLIILSIYLIRFIILRIFVGTDILPQLFVAPRGLITVLLFYAIPTEANIPNFEPGILLFIIIGTSLIMTLAMVADKKRTTSAIRKVASSPVGYERWKAPTLLEAPVEKEA
ncbi:NhaP-type Na+/H+ or K+/H+ antiporter [Lewinella aquimaris]|uniref:NhaP-type Na+/H+ or K+/H+ antiporter n=1 Tax=Neolewinella aquimaris TaxID=1835722 RepID=A0A840E686_9BACT|nr:cation:proton antiporter [Neolewinella aquimaris]MBB4080691.1 NhaP-type Na+/H+ or K+/H+ antiporter [Neolewinella aquimaris]